MFSEFIKGGGGRTNICDNMLKSPWSSAGHRGSEGYILLRLHLNCLLICSLQVVKEILGNCYLFS